VWYEGPGETYHCEWVMLRVGRGVHEQDGESSFKSASTPCADTKVGPPVTFVCSELKSIL
jgi:hypothetical protein